MILIYELSANGKPKSWKASPNDTFNWPRLLHLCWLEYDENGQLIKEEEHLIKPEGFDVPEEVEKFHHVKYSELLDEGEDLKEVLLMFRDAVDRSKYIFSFNQALNEGVLQSEFYRKSVDHRLEHSERFCLMRETTYFCKIPSKTGGYKWPSLQELHQSIFGNSFKGANNAKIDLVALTKCFNQLWSNGELDDLF